jgi:hypothetical protein
MVLAAQQQSGWGTRPVVRRAVDDQRVAGPAAEDADEQDQAPVPGARLDHRSRMNIWGWYAVHPHPTIRRRLLARGRGW